jgi:hypothetical protein
VCIRNISLCGFRARREAFCRHHRTNHHRHLHRDFHGVDRAGECHDDRD